MGNSRWARPRKQQLVVFALMVPLGVVMIAEIRKRVAHDILDRQVQLILVVLTLAAVFRSTIGEHAQQRNFLLLEERQHAVVEQLPFTRVFTRDLLL
jgi:hypothetical protein